MPKRYHINDEQADEIKKARKENKDKNVEKRLKALLLHAAGKTREIIAQQTGFVKSYISELVAKYCNQGLSAITETHYPGNHRNLSYAEEEALLEPFRAAAQAGQIVDVGEIKRAYEEAIGHSLENSHGQIYNVLHRHGWRKIMPRSKHPDKASEEAIEASKKLTKPSRVK
jgi:transposase